MSSTDGLHVPRERGVSVADAERVGVGRRRRVVAGSAVRARRHAAHPARLGHSERVAAVTHTVSTSPPTTLHNYIKVAFAHDFYRVKFYPFF